MTPTNELRTRLRRLLDEKIPAGGADSDTRFLDDDLDDLIREASSIYGAAAQGWIEKAGMYQREMMDIESMTAGQETHRLTSLKDRMTYALRMAETYGGKDQSDKPGSMILGITPPEVL